LVASYGRSCNTEDIDHAPDEIVGYTTEKALRIGRFRSLPIVSNLPPADFRLWDIVGLCAEYCIIINAKDRNSEEIYFRSSSFISHKTPRSQDSQSDPQTGTFAHCNRGAIKQLNEPIGPTTSGEYSGDKLDTNYHTTSIYGIGSPIGYERSTAKKSRRCFSRLLHLGIRRRTIIRFCNLKQNRIWRGWADSRSIRSLIVFRYCERLQIAKPAPFRNAWNESAHYSNFVYSCTIARSIPYPATRDRHQPHKLLIYGPAGRWQPGHPSAHAQQHRRRHLDLVGQ
jgi:hypothetical protein